MNRDELLEILEEICRRFSDAFKHQYSISPDDSSELMDRSRKALEIARQIDKKPDRATSKLDAIVARLEQIKNDPTYAGCSTDTHVDRVIAIVREELVQNERCESGCKAPVVAYDNDGVPLCLECWGSLLLCSVDAQGNEI